MEEIRGAQEGIITECTLVSWTGSQNRKEILGKFSEIQIMCGLQLTHIGSLIVTNVQ